MRRIAIVGLLTVLALLVWRFQLYDLTRLSEYLESLRVMTANNPLQAAVLFFLVYVGVTAASLPGAAILTLACGGLFGFLQGVVIASFASTLGATLAMMIARTTLGDWVQRRFAGQLQTVNRGIEKDGAFYLFALRLVPLFPFFVINLVMGLTRMPWTRFAWVSQLGMLPGTAVYVYAGSQAREATEGGSILSPSLFAALLLLAVFPFVARALVRWVRAKQVYRGWKKPRHFDANLLVIGGGSAGLIASLIGGTVRAKTVLIERERMGGDCLHTGCVPSKTLIASAKIAQQMRTAERFGIRNASPDVDFAAVMQRVQSVVATIEPKDSPERYTSLGVECIAGDARFVDPWTVAVNGKRITARSIVIASGAEPFVPPIPGLGDVPYLTSNNLWQLRTLPKRLVVLGGGPIGCELAQAFARLGSEVTLIDMLDRILPKEDPEVSQFVTARFAQEGIRVLTSHAAVRVEPGRLFLQNNQNTVGPVATSNDQAAGAVATTSAARAGLSPAAREVAAAESAARAGLVAAASEAPIPFDELLVAVGRKARLNGLGLEAIGFAEPLRALEVDERLATRFPHIFACGDVIGPYQFTHMASHQAWYAAVNGLFRPFWGFDVNYSVVPWATYTDPEVAQVGLNETMAKQQGVAYEVTRYGFDDLDRALADGTAEGWMKVLTAPNSDRILGVTIVGDHAGELLAEATLAMTHRLGLGKLMGTIHVYPTKSEAHKLAAGAWRRKHAPQKLLEWAPRLHSWLRGA